MNKEKENLMNILKIISIITFVLTLTKFTTGYVTSNHLNHTCVPCIQHLRCIRMIVTDLIVGIKFIFQIFIILKKYA